MATFHVPGNKTEGKKKIPKVGGHFEIKTVFDEAIKSMIDSKEFMSNLSVLCVEVAVLRFILGFSSFNLLKASAVA